jgi:tyrosine-protein phosphatase SIW14
MHLNNILTFLKHRTGCAVAVIRKVLGWSVEATVNEYTSYAHPKVRQVDVNYIRQFEVATLVGVIDPKTTRTASFSKPRVISRSHKPFRFAVFTIFVFILCTLTVLRYRIA